MENEQPVTVCPRCGKPLLPSDRFCGFCGQTVEQTPRLRPSQSPLVSSPTPSPAPTYISSVEGWGGFLLGFSIVSTLVLVIGEVLMWMAVQDTIRRDNSSPGLMMIAIVFLVPPPIALILGCIAGGLVARQIEQRRIEGKDVSFANYGYGTFLMMILSGIVLWFMYISPSGLFGTSPAPRAATVRNSAPPPAPVISPSPRPQVQITNLSNDEISQAGRELPALLGPLYYPGAVLPPEFVATIGRTYRSGQAGSSPLYPSIALIAPPGTTIDAVTTYYQQVAPGGQLRPDGGYLVNDVPRPGDGVHVRVLVTSPIKGPNVGRVVIMLMTFR